VNGLREVGHTLAHMGWAMMLVVVVLGGIPNGRAGAASVDISAQTDLCARINELGPGDELILQPGDYQGPCVIRRGGRPGAPLVIRAADREQRPRIMYGGTSANVFEIRASGVVIRGLEFGPTREDVDAVRIVSGHDITVEDCHFSHLGGIAVAANHVSVRGLTIRHNHITDVRATGMYFGCQDGLACVVSGLLVERNYIRGVTAPEPQIGYGLEVKLNSSAVIRDNVILDTKGPGIMTYGARDLGTMSLVERNVVVGSRQSSGIVVGGGPAIVRNNVAVSNREAGIAVENYRQRHLLRSIKLAHNTVYGNLGAGISVPDGGLQDIVVVNNAAQGWTGTVALPGSRPGLRLRGNVDCTGLPCFTSPQGMDFSPFVGSLLIGPGLLQIESWMPRDDLFGKVRGTPPTVGAIEHSAGPLPLVGRP
jgi:hypothetical protein